MSLFSLRKKIQERIDAGYEDEYERGYGDGLKWAIRELENVEKELSSRVSQLEKIRRNRLDIDKSLDVQCELKVLRGVLGK